MLAVALRLVSVSWPRARLLVKCQNAFLFVALDVLAVLVCSLHFLLPSVGHVIVLMFLLTFVVSIQRLKFVVAGRTISRDNIFNSCFTSSLYCSIVCDDFNLSVLT